MNPGADAIPHHAPPGAYASMARPRQIAWVAGELSGDSIAAGALALIGAGSATSQRGVGGPAMRKAGLQCDADIEELSLRGYVEVFRHLPRLLRLRARLSKLYSRWPADCFVGVDAPDFNLGLERRLRARSIPTVHMVGPSIWAWRPNRKFRIASCADHLLLLFPFEPPLYQGTGIQTHYVGHPMADAIDFDPDPHEARQALGIARYHANTSCPGSRTNGRWICLLPGSRTDEVVQHGPLMLEVAQVLAQKYPRSIFLVPAASVALYRILARQVASGVRYASDRIFLVLGNARTCMAASDQILAASGTVCLESALLGRPLVVTYRMPELSYAWMKRQQLQPWVGLPNILAARFLVPELLQREAQVGTIVEALEAQWRDEEGRGRLREEFMRIHRELRQGCAGRTAAVLRTIVGT